ncbi:hypothetical protein [Pantoea sp. A4]|uniref:hypothetical protein n=1 Tax=Pantoea sp. A4 TaxID=1225184 RepID=UPI000378A805|nr:hypothetical protein [Pantoea sp. A4]
MSQSRRFDNSLSSHDVLFIAANEQQTIFYYCAGLPRLRLDNADHPAITYTIYRNAQQSETVYYAMLNLQSVLTCTYAQAEAAAREHREIPAEAILLPLQVTACHVTLDITGFIPTTVFPAAQNTTQNCLMAVKFSDTAEIETFKALLRQPTTTPLAVSYKIDYIQQLPPSTFELIAEWQQVYTYLEEHVGFNFLLFSVDIEKISSLLITEHYVTIKTRIVDPGSIVEQAGRELTQILLAEFFSPVFTPPTPQHADRVGFYLQKITQHDYSQRQLSARLEEYSAVKRAIYPQALLAQMVDAENYQAERIIQQQDISDDFFTRRKVTFHLLETELDSNILLLLLNVRYGEKDHNYTFNQEDVASKTFSVPAIIDADKAMRWPVAYQFSLYFRTAIAGISEVHSDWQETSLEEAWIDAAALYSQYHFSFLAVPGFNWQWYSQVTLNVACTQYSESQRPVAQSLILTEQAPTAAWPVMLPGIENFQFSLKAEYQRVAGLPHLPATLHYPIGQQAMLYSSLFPQRSLLISASADWQQIRQIQAIVQFRCGDSTTPILKQTFLFNQDRASPQLFSADQPDPERRTLTLLVVIDYLSAEKKSEQYPLSTDEDAIDITQRD